MGKDRWLELTASHHASMLGEFAFWRPRLLVVVRGTPDRWDRMMPQMAERIRLGARGVSIDEGAMTWRDLGHEEIQGLVDALAAIPADPDVRAVVDTGDYFEGTVLTGALDQVPFHLRVEQMQSGYRGRDAASFAALMRRILQVADLDPADERWRVMLRAR